MGLFAGSNASHVVLHDRDNLRDYQLILSQEKLEARFSLRKLYLILSSTT